jgi:hypothetical protein
MKKLYASVVLWLIRPALDLNAGRVSVVVVGDSRARLGQSLSPTEANPKSACQAMAAPLTVVPTDVDEVTRQNSEAAEELLARQRFVEIRDDRIPGERLEEGVPIRWGDEAVAVPFLPHGDDGTRETG